MSTTHTLDYVRFTRQANTEPIALLSTNVAAKQAYQQLQQTTWKQETEQAASFPARKAVLTAGTPTPLYDAYKYCGDYADGKQKAYAGAVAYRFQIPAEALTGTVAEVVSVAIPVYVDRWLVDGVRISAYVTDAGTPPSDWATVSDGDATLTAQLPMQYTADTPPARIVIEKNDTLTLTMPADLAAKKYLYVMLTLQDYESTRDFWIEGAGLIVGGETVVTFDRSVTADPDLSADYVQPIATPDLGMTGMLGWPALFTELPGTGKFSSFGYDQEALLAGLVTSADGMLRDIDTGFIKTSAILNQRLKCFDGYSSAGAIEVPKAAINVESRDSTNWEFKINRAIFPLYASIDDPLIIRKLTIAESIGTYDSWMRIRLNIYARNTTDPLSSFDQEVDIAEVMGYTNALSWARGIYSSNGLSNLLSTELSPAGYAAGSEWSVKPFSAESGVVRFYITISISRIVAAPDSDLGVDGSEFGLAWKTDKMLIN